MHDGLNTGITVVGIHSSGYIMKCRRLPTPGEYLIAKQFERTLDGGKASNQALAAARLGARSHLVAMVGSDADGKFALDYLASNDVDTSNVTISGSSKTSVGIAFIDENGTPLGATDPGASAEMTKEHLDKALPVIKSSRVLLTQLEIPAELALYACELGKRNGLITILNPAPADNLKAGDISNVDILTPNEPEAKLLAGYPPDSEMQVELLGRNLYKKSGVKHLIITLGKDGALLVNEEGLLHFDCPKMKPVDTSGAGDCFNASLAFALCNNVPLKTAVEFAIRTASLSVTKPQVWPSYPTAEEVRDFYGGLW